MLTHNSCAALAADFEAVSTLMPGAYLVLSPQLRVELVSAGYQAAVSAGWPNLSVGDYLPTVLEGLRAGQCVARKLTACLAQVLQTGQPHEVASLRAALA